FMAPESRRELHRQLADSVALTRVPGLRRHGHFLVALAGHDFFIASSFWMMTWSREMSGTILLCPSSGFASTCVVFLSWLGFRGSKFWRVAALYHTTFPVFASTSTPARLVPDV